MGQSCAIHQKQITANNATQTIKTTENLVKSAMEYSHPTKPDPPKPNPENWAQQGGSAKGAWQDERDVKAGHFNEVYVRGLKRAVAETKESKDCTLEDMEGVALEPELDERGEGLGVKP